MRRGIFHKNSRHTVQLVRIKPSQAHLVCRIVPVSPGMGRRIANLRTGRAQTTLPLPHHRIKTKLKKQMERKSKETSRQRPRRRSRTPADKTRGQLCDSKVGYGRQQLASGRRRRQRRSGTRPDDGDDVEETCDCGRVGCERRPKGAPSASEIDKLFAPLPKNGGVGIVEETRLITTTDRRTKADKSAPGASNSDTLNSVGSSGPIAVSKKDVGQAVLGQPAGASAICSASQPKAQQSRPISAPQIVEAVEKEKGSFWVRGTRVDS